MDRRWFFVTTSSRSRACDLWVDVAAFEAAAEQARRSQDPAAYDVALDLYLGDLLPEDLFEDWVAGRREELRGLYLSLLIELAGLHEERGQQGAAIAALQRVVAINPVEEEAHVGLIRLYATTGQRNRALRQYQMLREVLSTELDVEPDERAQELYQEILAGRFRGARPAVRAAVGPAVSAWATCPAP